MGSSGQPLLAQAMNSKQSPHPLEDLSEGVAHELDTDPETVRAIGIAAAVIVAISAIIYIISLFVGKD